MLTEPEPRTPDPESGTPSPEPPPGAVEDDAGDPPSPGLLSRLLGR